MHDINNELLQKFIANKYSLDIEELDILIEILIKQPSLASEIKETWLLEDLLSRLTAMERGNFSPQVLKRIQDLKKSQSKRLSISKIKNASSKSTLTQSGRYRRASPTTITPISTRILVKEHKKKGFHINLILLAAMGLICIGFLALLKNSQKQPELNFSQHTPSDGKGIELKNPPSLAKIMSFHNAFYSTGEKLQQNDSIKSNQLITIEQDGYVQLNYTDESFVNIEENSSFLIENKDHKNITLLSGSLNANISKQKFNFIFNTENAKAEILGTQIKLRYMNKQSELQVLKGSVQFGNKNGNQFVTVTDQKMAIITDSNPPSLLKIPSKKIKTDFANNIIPEQIKKIAEKNATVSDGSIKTEKGHLKLQFNPKEWQLPITFSIKNSILPRESLEPNFIQTLIIWDKLKYGMLANKPYNLIGKKVIQIHITFTQDNFQLVEYQYEENNQKIKQFAAINYFEPEKNAEIIILLRGSGLFSDLTVQEVSPLDITEFQMSKKILSSIKRTKGLEVINHEKFPFYENGKQILVPLTIQYGNLNTLINLDYYGD